MYTKSGNQGRMFSLSGTTEDQRFGNSRMTNPNLPSPLEGMKRG